MKAKEYAEKYKESPTDKTVGEIAIAMLAEVKTIAEIRHAQSPEALISILNEAIDKWRKFSDIVGDGVRPDGLKLFIIKDFPFIPKHLLK
jgi:hypothetical protein